MKLSTPVRYHEHSKWGGVQVMIYGPQERVSKLKKKNQRKKKKKKRKGLRSTERGSRAAPPIFPYEVRPAARGGGPGKGGGGLFFIA